MKYYKFLTEENKGKYSYFDFTPYIESGEWLPEVEELEKCQSGYHACGAEDLAHWIDANLYEVEYKDAPEEYKDKVNGHSIRFVRKVEAWNKRTARLFAVWCAREALKLVDEPDPRSVNAVDVAERFANGEATKEELAAAYNAAYAAAYSAYATRAAAYAAAYNAAFAARAAAYSAYSAYATAFASDYAARAEQSKKLAEMLGLEDA